MTPLHLRKMLKWKRAPPEKRRKKVPKLTSSLNYIFKHQQYDDKIHLFQGRGKNRVDQGYLDLTRGIMPRTLYFVYY